MKNKLEQGFILLLTVVMVFATALVAVGIMSMVKDTQSSEQMWTDNDECFMLSQSIVGKTRSDVYTDFENYFVANNSNTAVLTDWFENRYIVGTYINQNQKLDVDYLGGGSVPSNWQNGIFSVLVKDKEMSDDKSYVDFVTEVTTTIGTSTRRFQEKFRVKIESRVFEYAYFINNKGWLFGSTLTVNGKMRANGDILLSGNPTINGKVYSSWNSAIRRNDGSLVKGNILDQNELGTGAFNSQAASAYDAQWLTALEMASGSSIDPNNPAFVRDFNDDPTATDVGTMYNPHAMQDSGLSHLEAFEEQDPLTMPFLGDLQPYIDSSRALADSGWGKFVYTDQNGVQRTIDDGHFGDDDWEKAGPDGVIGTADDGTLIITGNFSAMGSLVVDGDLIISGTYGGINGFSGNGADLSDSEISDLLLNVDGTEDMNDSQRLAKALELKAGLVNGKGSIYAGRNIHIIGNLSADLSGITDMNKSPFMALSSKGNIILGNYSNGNKDYTTLKYMVSNELNNNGLMEKYATGDRHFQNDSVTYVDNNGNTVVSPAFDGNYINFEPESLEALNNLTGSEDRVNVGKVLPLGSGVSSYYVQTWPQKTEIRRVQIKKYRHSKDCKDKKNSSCPFPGKCERCKNKHASINLTPSSFRCFGNHEVMTASGGEEDDGTSPCCTRVKHYYYEEVEVQVDDKSQPPVYERDPRRFIITGYNGDKNLDASQRFFSDQMSDVLNEGKFPINIDGEIYTIQDMNSSKSNYFVDENGTVEQGVLVAVSNEKHVKPGESFSNLPAFHAKMYHLPSIDNNYMPPINNPRRVDAVLYTNHLFGGRMKNNGAVNGAVVARDEAIKFMGNGYGSFNWDPRLSRSSNEPGASIAMQDFLSAIMPKTFDPTYDPNKDIIQYWREVPVR